MQYLNRIIGICLSESKNSLVLQTQVINKLKKKKVISGKIIISLIFVFMALHFFWAGTKNLKDVLSLRDEIKLHLTSYGTKLLLLYDFLLHTCCIFIVTGVYCLYNAWEKLKSYKCRCGWRGMCTYKYCPEGGREISADNEL